MTYTSNGIPNHKTVSSIPCLTWTTLQKRCRGKVVSGCSCPHCIGYIEMRLNQQVYVLSNPPCSIVVAGRYRSVSPRGSFWSPLVDVGCHGVSYCKYECNPITQRSGGALQPIAPKEQKKELDLDIAWTVHHEEAGIRTTRHRCSSDALQSAS